MIVSKLSNRYVTFTRVDLSYDTMNIIL